MKPGFAITPFARWFPGNLGKHSTWRVFKHGRSSRLTSPHAESSHGDIVSTATAVTREEPEPGRGAGKLLRGDRRTYGGIHLVLGWWVVLIEWQDVLRLAFMKQESSWAAAATTAPIF